MNKAILIGRICNYLQLKNTTNNNKVCEFSLAINRVGSEETDFLNIVVWNKQAENLCKYQSKGSLIAVEGSNRCDKYVNENGENRYRNYILANNIQFLGTKTDSQSPVTSGNSPAMGGQVSGQVSEQQDPFRAFGQQVELTDNDLPF